jgi:hypothetical protein
MRRIAFAVVMVALLASAGLGGDSKKKYGFLGITLSPVSKPLAAQLGFEKGEGVLVVQVADDSPAAKAGLADNDVIVRVDDQIILAEEQFRKLIGHTEPGMVVTLQVIRRGKRQEITAKLGGTDREPAQGRSSTSEAFAPGKVWARPVPPPDAFGRYLFEAPGRTIGRLRFRGPDGEEQTLKFGGDANVIEQLKELQAKGLIDKETLDRMQNWAGKYIPDQGLADDAKATNKKRLEETKKRLAKPISFDFVATPASDVAAFIRDLVEVNVLLDPALQADNNAAVTLRVQNMPAHDALAWIAKMKGWKWTIAHGIVGLGKPQFVTRLRDLPPLRADDEKLSAALGRELSFDSVATPLPDVLAFLQNLLNINVIVMPAGDNKDKDKETLTLRLEKTPASTVLPLVGVLVNRTVTVHNKAVLFGKPGVGVVTRVFRLGEPDAAAVTVAVQVAADGTYRIGEQQLDAGKLEAELAARLKNHPDLAVVLIVAPDTPHKHAVSGLSVCKKLGVKDVKLKTPEAGR